MPTRLKYDGLPEGTHTFTYDENREKVDRDGKYVITGQPRIPDEKGSLFIDVEDLDDPKSERARQARLAIASGLAHVVEPKASKKDAAPKS